MTNLQTLICNGIIELSEWIRINEFCGRFLYWIRVSGEPYRTYSSTVVVIIMLTVSTV